MAEPKREPKGIDIAEFRKQGYLHEINRLILHPLGLGLGVAFEPCGCDAGHVEAGPAGATFSVPCTRCHDGFVERLGGIWDHRDDPEGMQYGDDLLSSEKGKNVARLWLERQSAREKALGYMIQPLDGCPDLTFSMEEVEVIADALDPSAESDQPALEKVRRYLGEIEAIFGPQ